MGLSSAVAKSVSGGGSTPISCAAKATTSCGGGRFVVGDIIDAAKLTLGQKPRCRADILDANAIEDLVRLDDALGGALFQIDEGVAPRPIDTREPEHGDGQT